jgi:1-pyrroline-5-carboxylate dehydrogenase
MNNAIYRFHSESQKNEPVLDYAPGSEERRLLEEELAAQSSKVIDIPLIIGGKRDQDRENRQSGDAFRPFTCTCNLSHCSEKEVSMAIDAALKAKND